MTSPTTPTLTAPFDLALAKLGWPLAIPGGFQVEATTFDNDGNYPIRARVNGVTRFYYDDGCWYRNGFDPYGYALLLSLDLTSPAYRLAIQRAYEELREEVKMRVHGNSEWERCIPCWFWKTHDYCLARHLPCFQPQPENEGIRMVDQPTMELAVANANVLGSGLPQDEPACTCADEGMVPHLSDCAVTVWEKQQAELSSPQQTGTDTPETDAQPHYAALGGIWTVDRDFARRLEHERDEAKTALRHIEAMTWQEFSDGDTAGLIAIRDRIHTALKPLSAS